MICLRLHIPFSSGVPSHTGKDQALLSVCESSVSFYKLVRTLADREGSPFWRGHAPLGEGAPLWERARPFGGGRALVGKGMFILTWWVRKGAPLLQRARPFGKGLFQSDTLKT